MCLRILQNNKALKQLLRVFPVFARLRILQNNKALKLIFANNFVRSWFKNITK